MCQTSVVMEEGDSEELLLENVTAIEVLDGGGGLVPTRHPIPTLVKVSKLSCSAI